MQPCSGLSYRQLDGVEEFQAVPVPQIPSNEVDDEEEGDEEQENIEPEHDSSVDTEEYVREPDDLDQFEFDNDNLQGDESPREEKTGMGSLIDKLSTEYPHQSPTSGDNSRSPARTASPSPARAPSSVSCMSSPRREKSSHRSVSHSPGRIAPVDDPEEAMLTATKEGGVVGPSRRP